MHHFLTSYGTPTRQQVFDAVTTNDTSRASLCRKRENLNHGEENILRGSVRGGMRPRGRASTDGGFPVLPNPRQDRGSKVRGKAQQGSCVMLTFLSAHT